MKNAWHILTPQKCFAASSLLEATLNLYLNYLRHKLPTGDENLLWCWKCAGSCSKLQWSCLTFHVGYSDFQSRCFLQGFKKKETSKFNAVMRSEWDVLLFKHQDSTNQSCISRWGYSDGLWILHPVRKVNTTLEREWEFPFFQHTSHLQLVVSRLQVNSIK